MKLEYLLFDKLKEENTSHIDRHVFINKVRDQKIEWENYNKALTKLAEKKFLRVEGLSRATIFLLPNFYDALNEGGIDVWETKIKEEKELKKELIESSIRTNKISKRTTRISTGIAFVTLVVLLFNNFEERYFETKELEPALKVENNNEQTEIIELKDTTTNSPTE